MRGLIPWTGKQREHNGGEFAPLATFRSEVDRLFDQFFRDPFGITEPAFGRGFTPALDINETDSEVTVRAEMPGVAASDVDVSVTGNRLVVSGEKKDRTEKNEHGLYHVESRFGSFRREVELPGEIDPQHVEASFENGVLTVRAKKTATAQAKKIAVQAK
jgi:HSP20 family protein